MCHAVCVFQSEADESFLRSVRDGNLNLVLEHLDYAGVHVATRNAVCIRRYSRYIHFIATITATIFRDK